MQFKPSYLLGLNELVELAYIQILGLLMKRAPSLQGRQVLTQLVIQERMKIKIVFNEFTENRVGEYLSMNI